MNLIYDGQGSSGSPEKRTTMTQENKPCCKKGHEGCDGECAMYDLKETTPHSLDAVMEELKIAIDDIQKKYWNEHTVTPQDEDIVELLTEKLTTYAEAQRKEGIETGRLSVLQDFDDLCKADAFVGFSSEEWTAIRKFFEFNKQISGWDTPNNT